MLLQYFEYSLEKVVNISLLIWSLNNQYIALPNTYLVQPCQLITQMTRVNSRETKILPLKNWKFWLYFKSYSYIYLFIRLQRIIMIFHLCFYRMIVRLFLICFIQFQSIMNHPLYKIEGKSTLKGSETIIDLHSAIFVTKNI